MPRRPAIILDFATFIANGLIVFLMPGEEVVQKAPSITISWKQKFSDHFRYNRRAAILDIALAVSIAGVISFFARVAGSNHVWNAFFLTGYGLSVWIAGFMERSFAKKPASMQR